ncbi:hypothetical protein ACIF70_14650 [Actinacidiphila glaucinigra]|uniref:hypothetical protein n=1 Tax=Actinacidiphila glaucinigra TaxID=235986 RepID=UPI0037C9B3E6
MRRKTADIATAALERGPFAPGGTTMDRRSVDLDGGPVAAGVWTDGGLGFVLVLHRRRDGFAASELYWSTRGPDLRWTVAEHLSGGLTGCDPAYASSWEAVLADAAFTVLSSSESLLSTGADVFEEEDEGELVGVHELLVSRRVVHLRIERSALGVGPSYAPHTVRKQPLASPFALVAVRPAERVYVVAVERDGTAGEGVELLPPTE